MKLFPPNVWQPKRLIWAVPAIAIFIVIDYALHNGIFFPLPFITMFATVIVAGSMGGILAGAAAGLLAAVVIFHGQAAGFGPAELTGGLLQATIGSMIFVVVGFKLGLLRDLNAAATAKMRDIQYTLERSIEKRSSERDSEIAKVVERDEQLRQAMRLSGIGFFKWDAKIRECEFCSDEHAAHFGLTSIEFQRRCSESNRCIEFIHKDDQQSFLDAIAQLKLGKAVQFDYRVIRPNGDIRYIRQIYEHVFDNDGVAVSSIGSSLDLTELHESKEAAHRSQRLETIGNLTGGVAHDFNNLLAIILGNLELSLLSDDHQTKDELVLEAIKATNRGADLTKSLLSFARRAHLTPTRLNLNQTVNDTMTWNSRVLPETISLETVLFDGLWCTDLDAASAENAIINLLLNARDAMPEGGTLKLETANAIISHRKCNNTPDNIEPGHYVVLSVSDTGHGIASDKLERIFEPFYTEKNVGEGTGLGLSMVQGFLNQSNGAIHVQSEIDVGTTFKLYFRAADTPEAPVELTPQDDTGRLYKRSRILLVEDEEGVGRILRNILESAGHVVVNALTGDEALETFKTSGPFDILLSDIVMPGTLQGPALAEAIRDIEPDIPCVFLSGYASEAATHGNGLNPSDIRLMKPVSRETLLKAISDAAN